MTTISKPESHTIFFCFLSKNVYKKKTLCSIVKETSGFCTYKHYI